MKCCNTETKRLMHTTYPTLAARRTCYPVFTIQFLVPIKLYSHDERDRGQISHVKCDAIRIAPQPAFTRQGIIHATRENFGISPRGSRLCDLVLRRFTNRFVQTEAGLQEWVTYGDMVRNPQA